MSHTDNTNNANTQDSLLLVLDNLLSKNECKMLIEKCNQLLMEESINNGSIKFDQHLTKKMFYSTRYYDDEFRDEIWQRIKHLLPENAHSILPKITLSMYNDYGFFPMHQDVQYEHDGMFTRFTLNIFLNEEFCGGETDFFMNDKTTLRLSAKPKCGRGALFDEVIWHRGNTVTNGRKYLFRAHILMKEDSGNQDWKRSTNVNTLY